MLSSAVVVALLADIRPFSCQLHVTPIDFSVSTDPPLLSGVLLLFPAPVVPGWQAQSGMHLNLQ